MARRYITVTVANAATVRAALLDHLATLLGRTVVSGAMADAAGGGFSTTRAVSERPSADGLTVAFAVDDALEAPVHVRDRVGGTLFRPVDLAGMTVGGVALPPATERPETDFPDLGEDPSLMSRPGEPGSRRP